MPEQGVKVFIRIRPQTQKEKSKNLPEFIFPDTAQKQLKLRTIKDKHNPNATKSFLFDEIFTQQILQSELYENTSKLLTQQVLKGYNGTIFAYGQTGSGKTFTMMGELKNQERMGIIPRCFNSILDNAKSNTNTDFLIMCSYVELYNEELRDLLHLNEKTKLELRQSPQKGIFIKDLKKVPVTNAAQMMKYIQIGSQNRTTGQTLMNSESSRSHSIFTIYVESLEKNNELEKFVGSKFNLVDLAGSERQNKNNSNGDRFLQATKINLSLTALGKVISSLVQGRGSFIPYRDSKLTRLLQDSLGGNAKTVMIATISPSQYNYQETLSTLKYASRAKYITNVPIINLDPKDALLKQYESEIDRLREALGDIQKSDSHPQFDILMQQNKRIQKEHQKQKKQLIVKIKKLEQQFISSPQQLNHKYKQQRSRRQQKLSFMEKNYKCLENEVIEMKTMLTDLRRKYKNASKEIFQMETQHQKERQVKEQELYQTKKQSIMLKSVLNVLFKQKQLKNILGLGNWQSQQSFKLPQFYFKDRHTLAFPCQENDESPPRYNSPPRYHSKQKPYTSTTTSFGAKIANLARKKR